MHVLLLRPVPGNDRFGLGPFFRIEPLGLEYIPAALEARGHRTTTVDLRYGDSLERSLRRARPAVVGVACMHALETDDVLALTARIRRASPDAFILVGGHSAAAYPAPFFANTVDAICVDDGELVVPALADALRVTREFRYGVTGNLVIDPDWKESDFERLWAFVETHDLARAGFTILTPLPGTDFFEQSRRRLRAVRWPQYDMHHLLWEPRLGSKRFFELYCETWRRSILNLGGSKSWADWAKQVRLRDLPFLTRMLLRTLRIMRPNAYRREHRLASPEVPRAVAARDPRAASD
jgi:hypothetical protein